jgi:YD repeat-containing protein
VSYNIEARPTGLTLGNGVVRNNTFDPNRSQLATQTASKNGVSLMNLSYGYDAAAGQSGATTTAGNTHQLISLTGTINGTAETSSYTYDLQHRLVTSTQSSNGVEAQRTYSYDRWGNRTAGYDDNKGIHQVQSIALGQSGGAPANRIASVTNSGVTANYAYDAAGNVTNDGVHTYTYDAANRVVSVDGGAAAQYSYDHQNRRVKKVAGGATTHYVWEGGQVIAEHDGAAVGPWDGEGGLRLRARRADRDTQLHERAALHNGQQRGHDLHDGIAEHGDSLLRGRSLEHEAGAGRERERNRSSSSPAVRRRIRGERDTGEASLHDLRG